MFNETESNLVCGTLDYICFEMAHNQNYKRNLVDLWSLGIVAYEMLFLSSPFRKAGKSKSEVKENTIRAIK